MNHAPCPCSIQPQPLGVIALPTAQKLAFIGLAGMAVGAFVSHKRYEWAAPGALFGGALAVGFGYVVLPKP